MGKIDLSNIIFVGIRDSDAQFTDFYKKITLFGDGKNGDVALNKLDGIRYDHNADQRCDLISSFFVKHIREEIAKNAYVRFCYYNKRAIFFNPKNLQKYCCFALPKDLTINKLENKFNSRKLVKEVIKCLDYKFLKGREIDYLKCLELFGKQRGTKFVLQEKVSMGGSGTFLFTEHNFDKINKLINPDELYSISVYQKDCISINTHFLISDTNYTIFPLSIQIIDTSLDMLEYVGCDFPAYDKIVSKPLQSKVKKNVFNVCKLLQKLGYRGVGGIDLILVDNEVYFIEINPRFQSSTIALNYALHDNNLPTMNELDAMCFMNKSVPELPDFDVPYSKTEEHKNIPMVKCDLPMIKILDGYDEKEKLDEHAYKYSVLYKGSILEDKKYQKMISDRAKMKK